MLVTFDRVARLSIITSNLIGHLCNQVLFDGSERHFHGEIQYLAPTRHMKLTEVLITFDRVVRSSTSFPQWKGLSNTFLTMLFDRLACENHRIVELSHSSENSYSLITFHVVDQFQ